MRKIRVLVPILVVLSVFAAIFSSAAAIDENETITDSFGDVIDYNTGDVVEDRTDIEVDNIDIKVLDYTRVDKSVTFELEVFGEIEDRGDMSDFNFLLGAEEPTDDASLEFDMDTVAYTIVLSTSYDDYQIVYVNNSCQIIYLSTFEQINVSENDFSVFGSTLEVSFDLNTTDETYEEILAQTNYMRFKFDINELMNMTDEEIEDFQDLMAILSDEAPNQPLQAYSEVTNLGEIGKEIQFEAFTIAGQPPYTYDWDFGDGSSSTEKNPTHTYDTAGNYTYTLTATDDSGESVSDSGIIEIIDTDEDNGTPGFELILIIAAFALIVLWKRR
jgi:hypothetical protein